MLTAEEVSAVDKCDYVLRKRGMQMIILCENCFYHGQPCKVTGDNKRGSGRFEMTCLCKRRIYQPPSA
jgi:hypothetical protein